MRADKTLGWENSMKDKFIVCTLLILLISVSFAAPVGIVTDGKSSVEIRTEEQAIVSQAQTVLFDESHDPYADFTHDRMLSNMTSDLEAHGYAVENMTMWSESMILSADVIIIPIPTVVYSSDEFDLLERFVAKGGGLFIICDAPVSTTSDELASSNHHRCIICLYF